MLNHNDEQEERLKSTARALSHDPLFFPSLPSHSSSLLQMRGLLNDDAFYHRFHDHPDYLNFLKRHNPSGALSVFLERIEQLRCHLLGSDIYKGTKESLFLLRQEKSSQDRTGIYNFMETFFETGEIGNFKKMSSIHPLLDRLKKSLKNQNNFLETAQKIFMVLSSLESEGTSKKRKKPILQKGKDTLEEVHSSNESPLSEMGGEGIKAILSSEESNVLSIDDGKKAFLSPYVEAPSNEEQSRDNRKTYNIFTKKYDEVCDAKDLATREERLVLRHQLDVKAEFFKTQINPLALKLYRFLKAQSPKQWQFDEEEGLLNGARLSQKIINPTFPYCYKTLKIEDTDSLDTAITLLVDNSGSMRGRPITLAALSADVLAEILERCGVSLEVLGFTTVAWKGGRSYQEWQASEKSSDPGRLNDIRHIIYKSFCTPWRRARLSMGVMLKEGILKENIDGEALLWAAQRLMRTKATRKILMVISDGAPVDDVTMAENSPGYLENHLKLVIQILKHHPIIQLFAIGIGHDVGRFYPHSVLIKSAESLGKTLFEELPKLFKGMTREKLK